MSHRYQFAFDRATLREKVERIDSERLRVEAFSKNEAEQAVISGIVRELIAGIDIWEIDREKI